MKVVVITGSRDWSERAPIEKAIAGADLVLVGDARGCDEIALTVCRENGIQCDVFTAHWSTFGDKAGPKRNEEMATRAIILHVESGAEVECHAFPMPNSRGTYDCARRFARMSLPVIMHRAGEP